MNVVSKNKIKHLGSILKFISDKLDFNRFRLSVYYSPVLKHHRIDILNIDHSSGEVLWSIKVYRNFEDYVIIPSEFCR